MGEKKQLDWSRRAERDANSIYDYIAVDNQAAARQVMGELRKLSLTPQPQLGKAHIMRIQCALEVSNENQL